MHVFWIFILDYRNIDQAQLELFSYVLLSLKTDLERHGSSEIYKLVMTLLRDYVNNQNVETLQKVLFLIHHKFLIHIIYILLRLIFFVIVLYLCACFLTLDQTAEYLASLTEKKCPNIGRSLIQLLPAPTDCDTVKENSLYAVQSQPLLICKDGFSKLSDG